MHLIKKFRKSIVFKSVFGIVLILVIFALVIGIIGFRGMTTVLLNQYADGAFKTADTAGRLVNADHIRQYLKVGPNSQEYRSALSQMKELCNSQDVTFIYVIVPDLTDYAHITFVFSTMNENSSYTEYEFGYYRETTNDEYRAKYKALYDQEVTQELVIRDKGYIETDPHITAMISLKGSDGEVKGILCVQRQMAEMAAARRSFILKVLNVLILILALVIVALILYLHKMLLHPVTEITNEASRFAKENIIAEEKLTAKIKNRDEIGRLAGAIDQMEEQVQDYVENLTSVTAEKERISTELTLATRIQADMLPTVYPPFPDRKEFDVYAAMDPAKEVGGDFYDYFLVDDDHLCILIADVSGKGIPAALFMMASKIILANTAMLGCSPAEILAEANEAICSNNREEMFVTVWLGILEISTGKMVAANAGHEYPALKPAGGSFELLKDRHGFVLGGMADVIYTEYDLQLEPGAKLFVYTDGVPEATNAQNELFGTNRLITALNGRPDASTVETLQTVREAVDSFVQKAEQFDDLTMLCLEYFGPVQ